MKPSIALWIPVARASGGRPAALHVTDDTGRHRTSPALHVTRKTRSRRLAVAPLHHGASRATMEPNDGPVVTTPGQTVKAGPHRHKWMLSHGGRPGRVTLLAFLRLHARGACHEGADGDPQHAVNGQMRANTWALTLILHRTQRVADEAINRALDCSLTSHRGAPWSTPHVTCVTRHAQNAKPTC